MTLLDAFLAVLGFFVSPGFVAFIGGVLAIFGVIAAIAAIAVEGEEVFFDWHNALLAAVGALAILLGATLVVWGAGQ